MGWMPQIKLFKNYLRLERSLSPNSIEAYVRDIEKLAQYFELSEQNVDPLKVTSNQLQEFLGYVNELGLSAHSQARILSGIKAFYKYLIFEDLMEQPPAMMAPSAKRLG